jgi:Aldehyde dehydrogenase family
MQFTTTDGMRQYVNTLTQRASGNRPAHTTGRSSKSFFKCPSHVVGTTQSTTRSYFVQRAVIASGIQTSNLGRALRVADKIKAGTVWLNTWHKYRPDAPFGGYKMSGYGREQGTETLYFTLRMGKRWAAALVFVS